MKIRHGTRAGVTTPAGECEKSGCQDHKNHKAVKKGNVHLKKSQRQGQNVKIRHGTWEGVTTPAGECEKTSPRSPKITRL